MFRTSNNRGEDRYDFFKKIKTAKPGKIKLSRGQIKLIEDSDILSLAEKIELFLVALGNKLTTELYLSIRYKWNESEKKETADKKDVATIRKLLDKLPFIFFEDTLPKKNRQNGNEQKFIWFQISINQAVSDFMKKFPDDMTEFEEGVLYGYPLSAIRAYSGLIETKHDKPTAASYFLAGVCSADFWEDEQGYYQLWWTRLKELSPEIVRLAEEKFTNL